MSSNQNSVVQSIHRLDRKFDDTGSQMHDFYSRQTNGEMPDPNEFIRLLQQQAMVHSAMTAQFGLLQKPLKTVLNETK
ncbi:hypothetical protein MJ904_08890 [Massilia sp. MB5]|uniref:hypothetical protein n=1 Tax=unclassified Massilia TaxID=2609279 RepID=UPI00067D1A40|nr:MULTISPECIES: hypothetical protein [unclassified Massilia]AKU22900.1 hypothetical protein ACZ75_16915 [Massilia sp. NR 4-1]UMR32266.1 hypothetical protein MJ904_08890 [Massilia sp. MB5]